MIGSLGLISVGAIVITRQTPSDASFSRYPGSMVEVRGFLGAILGIGGLCGFFLALHHLLIS